MRDALSVLDQCLSFGEGAVSAARVREVLGITIDRLDTMYIPGPRPMSFNYWGSATP